MMEREEEGDVEEEGEVGVEEREVEEEEWRVDVEEEWRVDAVERGNMSESLEMEELESRPKISVEVGARATGELSRTMPRKEMRLLPTLLLRKLPLLKPKLSLLKAKSRKNLLRKKSQIKARRKKKRRLCTYREQTDRRSWTSTSPLLIKTQAVEAVEDVDVVEKEESSVSVVRGQKENSVNAARDPKESSASVVNVPKAIVHQGKKVMLPHPVVEEEIAEAVAVEEIAVVEEIVVVVAVEAVTNRNSTWTRRLSLLWDRSYEVAATTVRAWRGREHALIIVLTTYI